MNDPSDKTVHRQQQWAFGGALLAFAAALGGGIALGFTEPQGQLRRLPHGSTLELRGWTLTPGETFVDGNFWQRLARRVPLPYVRPGGFSGSQSSPSGLALWFRASEEPPVPGAFRGIWIDEHGCRISAHQELHRRGALAPVHMPGSTAWSAVPRGAMSPTPELRWVATPDIWPRRGSRPLTFAFVREGIAAPVATYLLPLPPEPGPLPRWSGPSTPVRATRGSTTFTLDRLRHGLPGDWSYLTSTADFRYQGPDLRSRTWCPALITVSDAAGNRLSTPNWSPTASAAFLALCSHEPAWKLKVRFARPDPSTVPPDRVWTWRDVPLIDTRTANHPVLPGYEQDGISVQLNSLQLRARDSWERYPSAAFGMTVSCPEGFMLTLTRVTDARGRSLGTPDAYTQTVTQDFCREEESTHAVNFIREVRPDSRRVNLTFALHRTRTVEFTVRP